MFHLCPAQHSTRADSPLRHASKEMANYTCYKSALFVCPFVCPAYSSYTAEQISTKVYQEVGWPSGSIMSFNILVNPNPHGGGGQFSVKCFGGLENLKTIFFYPFLVISRQQQNHQFFYTNFPKTCEIFDKSCKKVQFLALDDKFVAVLEEF
jgi:hypothetical protein